MDAHAEFNKKQLEEGKRLLNEIEEAQRTNPQSEEDLLKLIKEMFEYCNKESNMARDIYQPHKLDNLTINEDSIGKAKKLLYRYITMYEDRLQIQ
jgi:hypothetical protein